MIENTIKLSDVKIPFLIRKRNKGHAEVVGNVSIETVSKGEPFEFLLTILQHSRSLLTYDYFKEIVNSLSNDSHLSNFVFKIEFEYLIDRVSVNYSTFPYSLKCEFISKERQGIQQSGMSITLPVRIPSFYDSLGFINLTVFDSTTLFFEDILDFIVKVGKVKLFPILSSQDFSILNEFLGEGRFPQEYLDSLKGCNLGKSGECVITTRDFFNMYNMELKGVW